MKTFTVKSIRFRIHGKPSVNMFTGTLPELIQTFSYSLECGASYSRERDNKKILLQSKSIKSLISNLNKASQNTTNGAFGPYYELGVE